MHILTFLHRAPKVLLCAVLCMSAVAAQAGENAAAEQKPMVALTFDDGPSSVNTSKILDVLEENGARATFFVVGQRVAENAQILRRAAKLGCEIGNHTWDHKKLTELTAQQIRAQLQKTDDAVLDAIGVRPRLVRAPCGRYGCSACSVLDRPVILWSVDPLDWSYGSDRRMNTAENREAVIHAATENVRDGDIILLHDLYAFTAECCKQIVPRLREMGFSLVTVSELLDSRGIEPQAGKTYHRVPQ